jgi:hypothetical protein
MRIFPFLAWKSLMGVCAHLRHHFRRLVGADRLDRLQVMHRRRIDFIVSSPAILLKA